MLTSAFLSVLLIGLCVQGTSCITFSLFPTEKNITTKDSLMLKATVSDVTNGTLSWVVGGDYVANATIVRASNGTEVSDIETSEQYNATFIVVNDTVETNLTFTDLNVTFNKKEVKLTLGGSDSDVTTLYVEVSCGPAPNSSIATCTKPNCEASLTTNDTTTNPGKYQICNQTFTCGSSGNWVSEASSCGLVMCTTPGKWGDSCNTECGSGCPGGRCASNGTCVDESGELTTQCMEGYTGSTCSEAEGEEEVVCGAPPKESVSTCNALNCQATRASVDTTSVPGRKRSCNETYTCVDKSGNGTWTKDENPPACGQYSCAVSGAWGANCTKVCGNGCPGNRTKHCDETTGKCLDPSTGELVTKCLDGYQGDKCDIPICKQGCGDGECLAPNYCANCPKHFESGPTCRNIRLDGFLKGALPSLAVLAVIVIVLTALSRWNIQRKIKQM